MRRWMVLGALTVAGCVSELHGALTVDWQAGGKRWTMTPDGCASGQREGFFGVDLVAQGKDDSMVRVILDPRDGPVLRVNVPDSDKALTLTRSAACKNFDVHVERQHSTINGITNVAGHLRVSCEEPGLTLAADITFDACH